MSGGPEERTFRTSHELVTYLRKHLDKIDKVVIPVQETIQIRGPLGQPGKAMKGVGACIKLGSGESLVISCADAAMLINDGVLQRLKIKCALETLPKP